MMLSSNTAQTPNGLSAKDRVALAFSALALAISICTAYFTIARITEDIRVTIESFPFLVLSDTGDALTTRGPFTAIYSNLGNRSAVIKGASLFIDQKGRSCSGAKEESGAAIILLSDKEPFVLKENDVVVENTTFSVPEYGRPPGETKPFFMPLTAENKSAEEVKVTLCISFALSTPSFAHIFISPKEIRFRIDKKGTITFDHPNGYWGVKNKPLALYRRWSNILFE